LGQAGGGVGADEGTDEQGNASQNGSSGQGNASQNGTQEGPLQGGGPGDQNTGGKSDRPDPRFDPNSTGAPTVEGCDDEDNTARILCELATTEEDPFVKAELWDEYNEYVRAIRGR
jgi:hypothetical protein